MGTHHRRTQEVSRDLDGVATLAQLNQAGVTRTVRRQMVRSGQWRAVNGKGVVLHTGPLHGEQAWRAALLRVGPAARLGGITALQAHGLQGFDEPLTHVWVPKGHEKDLRDLPPQVVVHETRRWGEGDAVTAGIPRSRPAVATVQAALWSASRRRAALCLVMPIQQRLVRPQDVAAELDRVRRHEFRSMLRALANDVIGGVHSLNELDFTREFRSRGLPEPSRQARRALPSRQVVLDVWWEEFGVCVEVNGAGHERLDTAMKDEVRLIDLQASGDAAVPLSVLTLRVDPDRFFEALRRLLRSRGWRG